MEEIALVLQASGFVRLKWTELPCCCRAGLILPEVLCWLWGCAVCPGAQKTTWGGCVQRSGAGTSVRVRIALSRSSEALAACSRSCCRADFLLPAAQGETSPAWVLQVSSILWTLCLPVSLSPWNRSWGEKKELGLGFIRRSLKHLPVSWCLGCANVSYSVTGNSPWEGCFKKEKIHFSLQEL